MPHFMVAMALHVWREVLHGGGQHSRQHSRDTRLDGWTPKHQCLRCGCKHY